MKAFFLISLFLFMVFTITSPQCLAADQSAATAQDETKARITRAKQTRRVLAVTLNSGAVIKGTVQEVSDDHFKLKEFNSQFLRDVRFTEVDSVKVQSRFATAMKNTGKALSFLFLSRTGLILTGTALTVARYVSLQKKANARGRVLITP